MAPASLPSRTLGIVIVLLVIVLVPSGFSDSEFVKGKICIGTNGRMSVPSNREHHYRNLRDRYSNCTYVDGNLELTWLQDENLDLSFLHNIREVTGYVLISHVDVKRIVLPRLQIIRGRTLFKINVRDEEFALMVTLSKMHNLEMPALRDTLQGSIGLFNNYNLCHVKTINWSEIISDPKGQYVYVYNFTSPERECPPCDSSCEAGCWGEGPENCQKFSKENCSPQCYQGRCFGPNPRECCHLFCAGGCTGPKQSDCLACRNFYDDGVCKQECPPMQRYNSITYSWEPNPNGKYAYGATCVKNCPEHLLKDNGACVRSCPPNKKAEKGECVLCNGPCPKTCPGVLNVHSGNIDDFKDCTIIEGSITILDQSFKGYQQVFQNFSFGQRYEPMDPERLRVFSTLKEVTGYINIQAVHERFTNLSYFENLEVIGGRVLTEYFSSLYIVKTSLVSLGLKSLKKVNAGTVAILENKDLCFAEDIKWKKIKKSSDHMSLLQANKAKEACQAAGLVCDPQCSSDGCWGPGPDQCLSCANYRINNMCVENCSVQAGFYLQSTNICKPCHHQCGSTCHGPRADQCDSCRYLKDGPFCVDVCPTAKYNSSGECLPCHDNCVDGCTGPQNRIGKGGCNSCEKAIINGDIAFERCLRKNESCPDGYYYEWVGPQEQGRLKPLAGKGICRKCHPRCKKCTGYGFHELVCKVCTNYKRGEQCEDECPSDHYPDERTQECVQCDTECRECAGPGPENCLSCHNYKIYLDGNPGDNTTAFKCTSNCPPDLPHKIFSQDNSEPYCSDQIGTSYPLGPNQKTPLILSGVLIFCVILVVFLAILVYQYCRKVKVKENTVKMSMVLTGLDNDNEPLRPTNVKPNLAKLRIVKEGEMRRGGILGYGAFGTVYKGVWVPEGESTKIPVAIKVLREGTGASSSKDFLEEAYIMATVEHPNLLQLLAVCMTSQMMLITQLMPLGCLLDFVRNNREKIGSKALLNWCTQIARGMSYLEEKRLVHRDLAARNVLVQTPNCVKITDFGLAKLLDINEDEYKAAGGKMPIKWLALECIQHRIFTHKSDVWAFGVTVWELLTYGGRPYENVPAREVPELLEKGERLPQPNICTIEVYMIMIKCWMLDAESRPGFKELSDEFAKMARDPGRYLVIPGDKFMRLPTYAVQVTKDEKDLLRNMGTTQETSESQLEGDEYLQPKSRLPITTSVSTVSGSTSPTALKVLWPPGSSVTSDGSCAPQNQLNWNQELLRYAAATGLSPQDITGSGTHSSDCSNTRYCSDPLKMLGSKDSDASEDCFDAPTKSQAQVGSLKLELPLDEDDYLMPSPQQNQPATAYVDLIGDSKHSDGTVASSSGYRGYPDFLPHAGQTNIDNPEYIMSQENVPSQTIGIPAPGGVPAEGAAPVKQYLPQKSSEEESDHEYYNDFDRLQRELQPLRKSETTV